VHLVSEAIRHLILSRSLFPGQQLLQDELAAKTGFSRGPMREALRSLTQEGLVTHIPNRGFFVTRFEVSEMKQLYTLRDLVETEVVRSLPAPTDSQISTLREVNEQIKAPDRTVGEAMRLNREFHFLMFEASPLKLMVSEIDRWWNMSSSYRMMGIGIWAERAEMMGAAHDAQIDAWADLDLERLVVLCHEHRWVSYDRVASII